MKHKTFNYKSFMLRNLMKSSVTEQGLETISVPGYSQTCNFGGFG